MNLPYLLVITTYPGASPEQVESDVTPVSYTHLREALIAPEQPEPCWLIIPASYCLQIFALNPACAVLLLYDCCGIHMKI